MKDLVRKILTKAMFVKGKRVEVPPSEGIVHVVYFSLGMVASLTVLETAHLIVLGKWNSEVFMIISALIGNITGIFRSHR